MEEVGRGKLRNKSHPGRPANHDFGSKSCFWHVSDVNNLLGIVKSSNMFLENLNTSVGDVEELGVVGRGKLRNKLHPGRPANHNFGSESCFVARFWT